MSNSTLSPRLTHLDGLRGISIILVLLNHIFGIFTSGFLGVDIFFVISGYIITKNILQGKYKSPSEFYFKRVLKILPPLMMTIFLLSMIFIFQGGNWFYEVNYLYLFILNLHFMQSEALYDSINLVRNSPLSHLWSLSVEEQFYIIAPIMLYLARGKKKILVSLLSILTFCSLTYYLMNFAEFPSASNYFTSAGRFWELGLGAMAAYFLYKKSTITIPRWLTELGIVLLLLITIRSYVGTLSLHLATLVVALLTTLLIISMESRVLKNKLLIFFGERSYSTYLYHLPIAYIILQYNDKIIGKSITIGLTILLSSLSFKYVERKILKTRASKKKVLFYVLIIVVPLVSLTNLIYKIGPTAPLASNDVKMVQLGERLNNFCDDVNVSCSLDNLKSKLDANASYWLCSDRRNFDKFQVSQCLTRGGEPEEAKIMVAGDSVAASYIPGLYSYAKNENYSLYTNIAYGCSWFKVDEEDIYTSVITNKKCNENVQMLYNYEAKIQPDVLVLSVSAMNRYNSLEGENIALHREKVVEYMLASIQEYLKYSKKIILVSPPPYLEAKNCEHPVDPTNKCDHSYDKLSDRVEINMNWYNELEKVASRFEGQVIVRDAASGTCYPSVQECKWETKFGNARASQVHLTFWSSFLFGETLNSWLKL